tara:strand:+ start:174 stop:407 length:234 start_codon:yes stop_codon:yes gene_type:complete
MKIDELTIKKTVAKVLKISLDKIVNDLAVGDIPEWDSLAHMQIFNCMEKEYGIKLDIDQMIEIEDIEDLIDAYLDKK